MIWVAVLLVVAVFGWAMHVQHRKNRWEREREWNG